MWTGLRNIISEYLIHFNMEFRVNLVVFSPILKGRQFSICFPAYHIPSKKRPTSKKKKKKKKKKKFSPLRSKIFPFKIDPSSEGKEKQF